MESSFNCFNCHKVGNFPSLTHGTLGFSVRHPEAPTLGHRGLLRAVGAVVPFAAALRRGRCRGRVLRCAKPRWLGGGLQEVMLNLEVIVVGGEGTIYGDKVFPWARDCLMELKSAGVQIVLLNYRMELEEGLQLGVHYDSIVEVAEDTEELENLGNLVSGPKERILVVGDSVSLMRAASRAGMPSAFICSGRMSQEFQMSPAPAIDVPANGGHFSEPENLDCWDAIFRDCPLPDYGLACFAFSERFFFRFFAERRAMARRKHSQRPKT